MHVLTIRLDKVACRRKTWRNSPSCNHCLHCHTLAFWLMSCQKTMANIQNFFKKAKAHKSKILSTNAEVAQMPCSPLKCIIQHRSMAAICDDTDKDVPKMRWPAVMPSKETVTIALMFMSVSSLVLDILRLFDLWTSSEASSHIQACGSTPAGHAAKPFCHFQN